MADEIDEKVIGSLKDPKKLWQKNLRIGDCFKQILKWNGKFVIFKCLMSIYFELTIWLLFSSFKICSTMIFQILSYFSFVFLFKI